MTSCHRWLGTPSSREASDSPYARGYFVATARQHFDCQDVPGSPSHGLLKASRDPLGGDTTISYDRYGLLPTAGY